MPGKHLLLVADEVHETGASEARGIFGIDAGWRLGLSATPQRYKDPSGTQAILEYFGPVLKPIIGIKEAIDLGRLVRYEYYPHAVDLDEEEASQWEQETRKIRRVMAISGLSEVGEISEHLKFMLIRRAKILKKARAKLHLVEEVFARLPLAEDRWLVYCEDQVQVSDVKAALRRRGITGYDYHTSMQGDPDATLQWVTEAGGVLVSIRCLDQGVDIPVLDHALILASSRNPRQYVQRRGRVLRTAPNKHRAVIHDAIVLPPATFSMNDKTAFIGSELARAIEFAKTADNASSVAALNEMLIARDMDPAELIDLSEED